MLKNSLYKISALSHNDNNIDATLEINKDNAIFSGHFPGQPVLPGACMLQIVKEVLESVLNKPLRLKKAGQIKFLRVVDPIINSVLQVQLKYIVENGDLKVNVNMVSAEIVCFKFTGVFVNQ